MSAKILKQSAVAEIRALLGARAMLTAIACAFAMTLSTAADAATIIVNSLDDQGTIILTSLDNQGAGICTLRDAITAVNSKTATNGW